VATLSDARRALLPLLATVGALGAFGYLLARVAVVGSAARTQDLRAKVATALVVLGDLEDRIAGAARRMADDPAVLRPFREGDPYMAAVALRRRERAESLDVCYLAVARLDGSLQPWAQGARLHVYDQSETDTDFDRLTAAAGRTQGQDVTLAYLSVVNGASTLVSGTTGPASGLAPGLYLFALREIAHLGRKQGLLACGQRVAPNPALEARLSQLLDVDERSPLRLVIRWQDQIVSALGNHDERGLALVAGDTFAAGQGRLQILGGRNPLDRPIWGAALMAVAGVVALGALFSRIASVSLANSRLERSVAELARREAERRQAHAEAQMVGLRAQMQPHFLFNVLNSISYSARSDPELTRRLVMDLADLYRLILGSGERTLIRLRDELEIVRRYLSLQGVRHAGRLTFAVSADEQLVDDVLVPPLIVQTLVENAVKHGIEPDADGGHVDVLVLPGGDAGGVEIRILNTGRPLDASAARGTGLANTAKRLELAFAGDGAFSLTRDDQGRTRASLWIPRGSVA
jgi:hypothetical protein